MPEYETLQLVWWLLIGTLFAGFALTDGFDIGVGALLPFVGKTDTERRILINAIAPHWDGNQVWFVLAAGAVFAAWPPVYGTVFSLMYLPMVLILFALFFRPVGFDYRSKLEDPRWRKFWDWGIFAGSAVPAFLFGVAFGNLFLGVPFQLDEFQRPLVSGTFFSMLHPFALLIGVLSLSLLVLHGAVYAQWRTEGVIRERLTVYARSAAQVAFASFVLAGIWLWSGIDGYRLDAAVQVSQAPGAWLDVYSHGEMILLPLLGMAGLIMASRNADRSPGRSFFGSSLAIFGVMATGGASLFPFIVPSSIAPADSLTVFNGTSSQYTLTVMMWAAIIFMPLVIGYTLWCYRAMWGRVTAKYIDQNSHSLY